MTETHPALVEARKTAAALTYEVWELLSKEDSPSRTIHLGEKAVRLPSRSVYCGIYQPGICDPNDERLEGTLTLGDLANALRCAGELLLLMDLGLDGSGPVPEVVVSRIQAIVRPRPPR